jgi:hypothetical protein
MSAWTEKTRDDYADNPEAQDLVERMIRYTGAPPLDQLVAEARRRAWDRQRFEHDDRLAKGE